MPQISIFSFIRSEESHTGCVLQLLHLSLKKSKVTSSESSTLEMLDPFVPLLLDCLNSMHVKVRCFCSLCTLQV